MNLLLHGGIKDVPHVLPAFHNHVRAHSVSHRLFFRPISFVLEDPVPLTFDLEAVELFLRDHSVVRCCAEMSIVLVGAKPQGVGAQEEFYASDSEMNRTMCNFFDCESCLREGWPANASMQLLRSRQDLRCAEDGESRSVLAPESSQDGKAVCCY